MQAKEYQKAAYRTANQDLTDIEQIQNAVMGMAGEAGEAVDIVKKWLFQGHKLDLEHLWKEAGDVLWYIALLCTVTGMDMEEIMEENIDKLRGRYPEKFDTKLSQHRRDGDI